jgi:hypothetical protein
MPSQIGGYSAAALICASCLVWDSAKAADLGDCCADLEERVADLEATTARKGNKKVSVTLYGQVNRAVLFWDDGAEKNVYVVDNNYESSTTSHRALASKVTPRRGLAIGSAATGSKWSLRRRTRPGLTNSTTTTLTIQMVTSSYAIRTCT